MRVISARNDLRTVAERWMKQYPEGAGDDKRAIGQKLAALNPETATPQEVAAIIGNTSWVGFKCDDCGKGAFLGLEVGDYEHGSTVKICPDCVRVVGLSAALFTA
jgi:hypothetical protein